MFKKFKAYLWKKEYLKSVVEIYLLLYISVVLSFVALIVAIIK